jgi:hypothetical protein
MNAVAEATERFDDRLPYQWSDLRQRAIGVLGVGDVLVLLGFGCAYYTGGPDGEIAAAFGMPVGSAWTITAHDNDTGTYTVERSDKKARQEFHRPPETMFIAVVKKRSR